jgi:hypothetical protein
MLLFLYNTELKTMNDLYRKEFFSANKVAELVGITKRQFDTIKSIGLIDFKHRYSLNEVIYIAFTNSFKVHNMNWRDILDFYNDIFGGVKYVKNLDYLKNDYLIITKNFNVFYFENRENELIKSMEFIKNITVNEAMKKLNKEKNVPTIDDNFLFALGDVKSYQICIYKIVEKIIEKSKELDLKVDVESILLSRCKLNYKCNELKMSLEDKVLA